jgi:adenine-specific DNA glycosylase
MKTRSVQIPLYVIIDRRGRILMRRESGKLFDGMFVLPRGPRSTLRGSLVGNFRHTITNRRITFKVFVANRGPRTANHVWVSTKDLANIPHPSYVRKALQLAGICRECCDVEMLEC